MASSNIKLFDENKGNMLSDSEFSISNQRMNGLQTGVASSQLQNKAMYQASLVAYAIAQIMMQNGKNANDTDAVSAFVANLSGTMLQKVYDLATTEEAQAGVATGKWMSPALVKAVIDKKLSDNDYLPKSGGAMTGNLILNANPTANLGAATKQYVDNVKTALTPVFGDLAKDGYFKLGDMSAMTYNGHYVGFEFTNFYNFLENNMSKLKEIVLLIKNSTWTNTELGSVRSLVLSGGSSSVSVIEIDAKATKKIDRIFTFAIGNTEYVNVTRYHIVLNGYDVDHSNGYLTFSSSGSDTSETLSFKSDNYDKLYATSIGTAEIWYK